jgi:hypothetical protein
MGKPGFVLVGADDAALQAVCRRAIARQLFEAVHEHIKARLAPVMPRVAESHMLVEVDALDMLGGELHFPPSAADDPHVSFWMPDYRLESLRLFAPAFVAVHLGLTALYKPRPDNRLADWREHAARRVRLHWQATLADVKRMVQVVAGVHHRGVQLLAGPRGVPCRDALTVHALAAQFGTPLRLSARPTCLLPREVVVTVRTPRDGVTRLALHLGATVRDVKLALRETRLEPRLAPRFLRVTGAADGAPQVDHLEVRDGASLHAHDARAEMVRELTARWGERAVTVLLAPHSTVEDAMEAFQDALDLPAPPTLLVGEDRFARPQGNALALEREALTLTAEFDALDQFYVYQPLEASLRWSGLPDLEHRRRHLRGMREPA